MSKVKGVYIDTSAQHVLDLASWMTQNTDCSCSGINSPEVFLSFLSMHHPELIIVGDLESQYSAWSVVQAIRYKLKPAYECRPYIVVITTGIRNSDTSTEHHIGRLFRTKCEECGADEVLCKPVEQAAAAKWVDRCKRRNQCTDWLAGIDLSKTAAGRNS